MISILIGENKEKIFFIFYLPLQIWTLKICNHDISQSITASRFKLGQLIDLIIRLIGENLRKSYFFSSKYLPLQTWTLKICNPDISQSITASRFKLGQLIDLIIRLIGENLRKSYFFSSNYLPLQTWTLKMCILDIFKSITVWSFKLGQLIEDD